MEQSGNTLDAASVEQKQAERQLMEALGQQVTTAIKEVGVDLVKAVERSVGDALAHRDATGASGSIAPDGTKPDPKTDPKSGTKSDTKPDALREAIPTLIATVAAGLLGAAAEKGSALRFAGSVPGAIDLVAKLREKRDAKELAVPFVTSALGAAGPMLIK
jgi:hypothetical protein